MPVFFLLMVSALWGLTFPLIELVVKSSDPFLFVALRFSLASLFALYYFIKNFTKKILAVSAFLGLLNAVVFLTQTLGLQTIEPSRGAFITAVYVLLVPFLAPLFSMGKPTRKDLFCALICLCGVFILTGSDFSAVSRGDIYILTCAVFNAIYIIYVGKLSKNDVDPKMITYGQIIMTAVFGWILWFFLGENHFIHYLAIKPVVSLTICSIFATIIAIGLQSKYQKFVSIQKTALIFSLEPVFAILFDVGISKQLPHFHVLLGGIIITISILIPELRKKNTKVFS